MSRQYRLLEKELELRGEGQRLSDEIAAFYFDLGQIQIGGESKIDDFIKAVHAFMKRLNPDYDSRTGCFAASVDGPRRFETMIPFTNQYFGEGTAFRAYLLIPREESAVVQRGDASWTHLAGHNVLILSPVEAEEGEDNSYYFYSPRHADFKFKMLAGQIPENFLDLSEYFPELSDIK